MNAMPDVKSIERSGSFVDNMTLPVHRWFRFSAGFSAKWAEDFIETKKSDNTLLLDPFAGSGTSLLASDATSITSIGIEAQPFIARIAAAKLFYSTSPDVFFKKAEQILAESTKLLAQGPSAYQYPTIIQKCYSPETIIFLDSLRRSWIVNNDNTPSSELVWLAITSILRPVSIAGTAQWQYVLPNKQKRSPHNPQDAFLTQIRTMLDDMRSLQFEGIHTKAKLIKGDSRNCPEIHNNSIDLVITSPPYANNYDYADATRLEMSFWGEINSWGDLHDSVRNKLIVSSSQHSSKNKIALSEILVRESLSPIRPELSAICQELQEERKKHGGKKHYHTMIESYFSDLSEVWKEMRRV